VGRFESGTFREGDGFVCASISCANFADQLWNMALVTCATWWQGLTVFMDVRFSCATVSDIKKAPWRNKCSVFQRFLSVVQNSAFDV
jgi:hypothetical protein